MYFTWTIRMGGAERTITWRDGTLSGDAFLIAVFLEYAKDVPGTIDPIPYSSAAGWQADSIVAQYILLQIGRPIRTRTNIPAPDWPEDVVY